MDFLQVVVLALVQGLTEFLPISSSAHLLLPKEVLQWPDQGLAFDVAVHVGSLIAVLWYFRRDLRLLGRGFFCFALKGEKSEASQLALALMVGTIPAIVVGFCFEQWIEQYARSQIIIAMATIFFGLLLWLADRSRRGDKPLVTMTLLMAFIIGCAQVFALIPGTSRSGVTITAALFLGFNRTASAHFSFLLSIPVIAGAGLLELIEVSSAPLQLPVSVFFWGALLSGISAYVCIRLFLHWIDRVGMGPFVIYRLVLGAALLLIGAR